MDDERLRQPVTVGLPDYFDELLERIRDIRASEQRLYLRVKDILALATDYQPSDLQTQTMFKTVQNKLHFAVTGLTAPEIIAQRVNPVLPNMGLTSWSGARVIKKDVKVAKNYLKEAEIKELNRIVGMFLDYAEDQAQRRKQVFLKDWPERLDAFLSFNDRDVLPGLGSVSRDSAEQRALAAHEQFNERRRLAAEDQGAAQHRPGGATMSFPRYPAYKPSGVEWLGEVPEHWEEKPLKRITSRHDPSRSSHSGAGSSLLHSPSPARRQTGCGGVQLGERHGCPAGPHPCPEQNGGRSHRG